MRLTKYKHTLSGFLSSYQDLISFQDGRAPCNLCCASTYSQICFHSASDQACLWAFSATRPGVLDGGFKGRIFAHRWGKDMAGMFRPIRERCPFANMNVPFANILSRSRVGSCSRMGRISANTLNTLHGYGWKETGGCENASVYADNGRSGEFYKRPCTWGILCPHKGLRFAFSKS